MMTPAAVDLQLGVFGRILSFIFFVDGIFY